MATLNVKDFPDRLYKRVQARAKRENRSLSQQVIHLLKQAVEPPEQFSILDLKGLGKELWVDVEAEEFVADERDRWDS